MAKSQGDFNINRNTMKNQKKVNLGIFQGQVGSIMVFVFLVVIAFNIEAQTFSPHWDSGVLPSTSGPETFPSVGKENDIYGTSYGSDPGASPISIFKWNRCNGSIGIGVVGDNVDGTWAGWVGQMTIHSNFLYVVGSFQHVTGTNGFTD